MGMLRDLRKKVVKKLFICGFSDPSLEDMALKYPVSQEELTIFKVGEGKPKNMARNSWN
jgi:ATP-dependent DNA helicase RecQ